MSGETYNANANAITKTYYDMLLAQGKHDLVYYRVNIVGNKSYYLYRG